MGIKGLWMEDDMDVIDREGISNIYFHILQYSGLKYNINIYKNYIVLTSKDTGFHWARINNTWKSFIDDQIRI